MLVSIISGNAVIGDVMVLSKIILYYDWLSYVARSSDDGKSAVILWSSYGQTAVKPWSDAGQMPFYAHIISTAHPILPVQLSKFW